MDTTKFSLKMKYIYTIETAIIFLLFAINYFQFKLTKGHMSLTYMGYSPSVIYYIIQVLVRVIKWNFFESLFPQ